MTDEGTPTTEEVREAFEYSGEGMDFRRVRAQQRDEFDRWLAKVKADTLRKAADDLPKPRMNAELSMRGGDGPFVDKGMEGYIEGTHAAQLWLRAEADRIGQEAEPESPPVQRVTVEDVNRAFGGSEFQPRFTAESEGDDFLFGRAPTGGQEPTVADGGSHLDLNSPAVGKCSRCGRSTWSKDEVGRFDSMPQPGGHQCGGLIEPTAA